MRQLTSQIFELLRQKPLLPFLMEQQQMVQPYIMMLQLALLLPRNQPLLRLVRELLQLLVVLPMLPTRHIHSLDTLVAMLLVILLPQHILFQLQEQSRLFLFVLTNYRLALYPSS